MEHFADREYTISIVEPAIPTRPTSSVVKCPVCPGNTWCEHHKNDATHTENINSGNSAARLYLSRSKNAQKFRADIEGSQAENDPIHSQILSYLFEDEHLWAYEKLVAQVERFRWKIVLSLLELKLWKTACILYPPHASKDVTDVLFWMKYGWKANKAAMRHHECITVVMENVIPFLDNGQLHSRWVRGKRLVPDPI